MRAGVLRGEGETGTFAAGDKVRMVRGTNRSGRVKGSEYNITPENLLASLQRSVDVGMLTSPGTTITWSSMPQAETLFPGTNRGVKAFNLKGYTQARLIGHVATASASANTPIVKAQWHTAYSTTASDYSDLGTSVISLSVFTGSTGALKSSWVNLSTDALTAEDIYLALIGEGGDGSASPAFGSWSIQFR